MATTCNRIEDLVMQMQGAFLDVPQLRLTLTAATQQFGESRKMCEAVLVALVEAKVLTQTPDGIYARYFPQAALQGAQRQSRANRRSVSRHAA